MKYKKYFLFNNNEHFLSHCDYFRMCIPFLEKKEITEFVSSSSSTDLKVNYCYTIKSISYKAVLFKLFNYMHKSLFLLILNSHWA